MNADRVFVVMTSPETATSLRERAKAEATTPEALLDKLARLYTEGKTIKRYGGLPSVPHYEGVAGVPHHDGMAARRSIAQIIGRHLGRGAVDVPDGESADDDA